MVFGGYDNGDISRCETWAYDQDEKAWEGRTPFISPAGRRLASYAYIGDGTGFLFGGIGNSDVLHGDTWIYDYQNNSWTLLDACLLFNNYFIKNTRYGISVTTNTYVTLIATDNHWGNDSGPHHPVLHPGGTGDTISGNIEFSPWIINDPVEIDQKEEEGEKEDNSIPAFEWILLSQAVIISAIVQVFKKKTQLFSTK